MSVESLVEELRRCAGWEDGAGAVRAAEQLALLPGDAPVRALVAQLVELDGVDLSEDAGDLGDEVHRARAALEAGLVKCGERAVASVRPLLGDAPRGLVAMRVLARLGDASVLPLAAQWSEDSSEQGLSRRLCAVEAFGWLAPDDASRRLRAVLAAPGTQNQGWLKRVTAHALGRLGDVEGLEVLLDDDDWFARLGAVEALVGLPRAQSERALARARQDLDERVRRAAGARR